MPFFTLLCPFVPFCAVHALTDDLAEVARHEPATLAAVIAALAAHGPSLSWQRREAALFAALASIEVVLAR